MVEGRARVDWIASLGEMELVAVLKMVEKARNGQK